MKESFEVKIVNRDKLIANAFDELRENGLINGFLENSYKEVYGETYSQMLERSEEDVK